MKIESFVIKTIPQGFDNTQLLLEGQLVIRNAAIIKKELLSALSNSRNLELILKNITKTDMSFLQLLVALQKSAAAQEKKLSFEVELTDYMISVVKNSGLETNFPNSTEV